MARTNDNEELDRFKMADPRASVLPAMGWMHQPKDGDKDRFVRGSESISVFKGRDGGWIIRSGDRYINVVQLAREINSNLGETRKFLRAIIGSEAATAPTCCSAKPPTRNVDFSFRPTQATPPTQSHTRPEAPAEDRRTLSELKAEIAAESVDFADQPIPGYLLERGFTVIAPVFRRAMRIGKDRFRNISFLYYLPIDGGAVELVSRENVGPGHFKNYLSKTPAGVWIAAPKAGIVDHIVICEAPLDCISSRTICGDGGQTAYFALRSGAELACVELVARLISQRGEGARVEIRTDNDPAGISYAAKISAAFKKLDLLARYTAPPNWHEDWTEAQEAAFAAHQKSA